MIERDQLRLVVVSAGVGSNAQVLRACESTLAAGATAIWLRERSRGVPELRELAVALRAATTRFGAALIVAGDVALAQEVAADAVHLGFRDPRPEHVRAGLAPRTTLSIGFSAHDPLDEAAIAAADYVTLSPLFPTPKPFDHPALGLARFAELAARIRCPIVALGGIDATNAASAIAAGACGVAVLRGASDAAAIRFELNKRAANR